MKDHRRDLASAVAVGARMAQREYVNKNPDAAGLRVRSQTIAYKPRPKEVAGLHERTVLLFLVDPSALDQTNADLARRMGNEIGRRPPANIFTETLGARSRVVIQKALADRQIDLDLALHNTVSKIKKALRARRQGEVADSRFSGTITFSADQVTVGEKIYPIQPDGRIHVGRRKLSASALKELLLL